MSTRGSNYDFIVHRNDKPSFGYMFEWGDESASPASVESAPPDIPISTSTGVTQAGGAFSARDAAPPYPIEINNWQDGAGQLTYDKEDSSPEAFRSSVNVDVTQEGHFELGPRVLHMPDWYISNKVIAALGTFWAGFTPDAEDDEPHTLRFLHRYTVTSGSGAGDFLSATDDTSLVVTDATDIADLSLIETLDAPTPETAASKLMGDYLYCPTHNEVIHVTGVVGTTLTVERGECGTTAVAHTAGETWYGFNWTPVGFSGTEPTQGLTALETDGRYVYAAFHTAGSDNGEVRYGMAVDTADAWTTFVAANNIVALCFCGGYLYGAQDKHGGSDVSSVGWFNTASSNAYTQISLTGAIAQGATTAALVAVGNFAYWVVTDGLSRSWVYRIQHSSTDTFELVSEMPRGFVATCAHSHLGNLYVGGYIDTLATTAGDSNLPRYEGALYLLGAESAVERVVKLRNFYDENSPDSRVKGLASSGPYIYILSNEDVYVYDTSQGGWAHYADTSTSTISGETADIDWLTNGFEWDNYGAYNRQPNDTGAVGSDYATWDANSDGIVDDGIVVADESSGAGFVDELWFYAVPVVDYYRRYTVNAGKYRRWTFDGLPTDAATLECRCNSLQSQAACLNLCSTSKEVRVYLNGWVAGGVVTKHRVGLGYMTDPDGGVGDYEYRWADLPTGWHTYRVTYSSSGARVYVDGVPTLQSAYGELRNVTGGDATKVRFSVGWPGDGRTDKNKERVVFDYVRFTADGAYSPDYAGGTLTTTGMKDIATMQGVTLVPVPGNGATVGGLDYINSKEIAPSGHLETSDSAFHMGSVDKYFTSVTVEHSTLQSGQTLTITPYIDDIGGGGTDAAAGASYSTAEVNMTGKKIRVRIALTDDDPNRPYNERLRVFRITSRFFPTNSPHLHTYYLNCREGVQDRSGHDWGYDPEDAIRNIFEAADSGEVVEIESLFTTDRPNGRQRARIHKVKLFKGPADLKRYDKLTGTCMVEIRKVDESASSVGAQAQQGGGD